MGDAESIMEQPAPVTRPPGDFDDLADGTLHELDPAFIRCESVGWWIFTAIIMVIGFVALIITAVAGTPSWIVLLVAGGLALITAALILATLRMPRLTYRHTSYTLSPLGLEIRQGLLWRRVTSVPRSRVQHTDVIQGPVMRHFGLAALTIHTAGTEQAAVTLQGLSHPTALRIRDFLVRAETTETGDGV